MDGNFRLLLLAGLSIKISSVGTKGTGGKGGGGGWKINYAVAWHVPSTDKGANRRERNPRRSRGYGRINEPLIESKVRANEARVEGARQNKRRIDWKNAGARLWNERSNIKEEAYVCVCIMAFVGWSYWIKLIAVGIWNTN